MKIYKISATYLAFAKTTEPFSIHIFEYQNIKETDKSYLFDGKRLKKDKLNKIEVEILSSRMLKGYVYVLENNIEKYTKFIYDTILDALDNYLKEFKMMMDTVQEWDGNVKNKIVE